MRSNELAELAGVTVRTLRHYHQIGLLDEPERSHNGYRSYTVQHLATVLRIVSFTDLGIPLRQIRDVINDPEAATLLLDRIDQRARDEIDRLAARRASIAALRAGGAAPDVPPALIPYAMYLQPRPRRTPRDDVYEREQLALIGHFTKDRGMPWLAAAFENLSKSAARYVSLMDDFAELSASTPAEERQALVDEIVELISAAVPMSDIPELDSDATAMLLSHQDDHYNGTQRQVWAQVVSELSARSAATADAGREA